MDDPETTQPIVYGKVRNHPTVYKVYAERLKNEKVLTAEDVQKMNAEAESVLQRAYDNMKEGNHKKKNPKPSFLYKRTAQRQTLQRYPSPACRRSIVNC